MPSSTGDHPELYSSPLLGKEQHHLYQNIVSMAEGMVRIGRFEISFAINSFNHFFEAAREGHLKWLAMIFDYFQDTTGRQKSIVISPDYIRETSGNRANTVDWLEKYPKEMEDIYEGLPEPRGHPLITAV